MEYVHPQAETEEEAAESNPLRSSPSSSSRRRCDSNERPGHEEEEEEDSDTAELVANQEGAHDASRMVRNRRRALVAASVVLGILGVLAAVAVSWTAFSPARRQSLADALALWSVRRHPDDWEALREEDDPKEDAVTMTECILDSSVGTLYLARAGLEVHAAVDSCERHRSNKRDKPEAYMELAKAVMRKQDNGRRLSSLLRPPETNLRSGTKSEVDRLIDESKAQLAQAQKFIRDNNIVPRGKQQDESNEKSKLGETWEYVKEVHEAKENLTETQVKTLGYQRLCGADIAGAFSSFSYVAAYFSAMISECQSDLLPDAYCASDVSRLLAATAEMTAGAAAVSVQCTYIQDTIQADQDELERRRLQESSDTDSSKTFGREMGLVVPSKAQHPHLPTIASSANRKGQKQHHAQQPKQPHHPHHHKHDGGEDGEEEESDTISVKEMFEKVTGKYKKRQHESKARQEEQAACAVDVLQAAGLMMRLGAEITGAHHHCTAAKELGLARQEVCMGSIAAIFASLCLVTMMVSNSVDECPEESHAQAICSSAIAQLVGSIGEIASAGFLIADSCVNYMGQLPTSEIAEVRASGPVSTQAQPS